MTGGGPGGVRGRAERASSSFAAALVVLAACSTSSSQGSLAEDTTLYTNDVSVLFPLPNGADKDLLLAPTAAGDKGELLPEAVFAKLPPLVAEGAKREDLRVVGLRIDPCFPGLGVDDPAGCKNQIRLVLQPIDAAVDDAVIKAKDAAVHAFYTMSRDELSRVARDILAAKHGAGGSRKTPLGPNPLIVEQGLGGPFATELAASVLRHAGRENLTRVTFLARQPGTRPEWKLGGFDVAMGSGAMTRMKIASLGDVTEQSFTTFKRNGAATPPASSPDDISLLYLASVASAAPDAELVKAYTAGLRILNPTRHSPDTIDCVSCHTATSAVIWAEKNEAQRPNGNPSAFVTTWNVALTESPASERPDALHAFGYLGSTVSISQRTANESAIVADYVDTKIFAAP